MLRVWFPLIAVLLIVGCAETGEQRARALSEPNPSRSADEAAILALEQRQAETWNRHEIADYAALFTEDAQVVNVLGWHWRSRAELELKLGRGFAWVFSESTLVVEHVAVSFINDDWAVAHVRWSLAGARSPTGDPSNTPQHGIQTQVLRKERGEWLIAHFQNTNSVPEMPMSLGPPERRPNSP